MLLSFLFRHLLEVKFKWEQSTDALLKGPFMSRHEQVHFNSPKPKRPAKICSLKCFYNTSHNQPPQELERRALYGSRSWKSNSEIIVLSPSIQP